MKKLLFAMMILPAMFFAGCEKDEDNCGIGDNGYEFSYTPESITVPAAGGEFTLEVKSSLTDYHAPELLGNTSAWVSEVKVEKSCAHHAVYTFKAEPNTTGSERTGYISVCESDKKSGGTANCFNIPVTQLAE